MKEKYYRREFFGITAGLALAGCGKSVYLKQKMQEDAESVSQKSKVEEALSYGGEYHNCCTAVLAAYAPELGMDRELAVRLTRGMPGIGSLGNVCGAVSGATMVIGLKISNKNNIHDREAQHKTNEIVREFVARFRDRYSSIECRELLGYDISTREKEETAGKDGAFINCPKYVGYAVEILEELLS